MTKNLDEFRLRVTGLGGQGVATLATVIAEVAAANNVNVSAIDRLTSAMRLSPIACDLRLGCQRFAPLIVGGTADVVLGMEMLEGTKNALHYVRRDGLVLLNTERTPRTSDIVMGDPYPDLEMDLKQLQDHVAQILLVEANSIAMQETGSRLNANFVMLGVLVSEAKGFPLPVSSFRNAIRDPGELRCFECGLEYTMQI